MHVVIGSSRFSGEPEDPGQEITLPSVNETIQLIRIGEQSGESSSITVCSSALAEPPWKLDERRAGYGPGASIADTLPAESPRQSSLPQEYRHATGGELDLRIRAARQKLGERLVILGHYYQRDEVIRYADFVGDSFQLAQVVQSRPKAE